MAEVTDLERVLLNRFVVEPGRAVLQPEQYGTCRYCGVLVKNGEVEVGGAWLDTLAAHERLCSELYEECSYCGKMVLRSEFSGHQQECEAAQVMSRVESDSARPDSGLESYDDVVASVCASCGRELDDAVDGAVLCRKCESELEVHEADEEAVEEVHEVPGKAAVRTQAAFDRAYKGGTIPRIEGGKIKLPALDGAKRARVTVSGGRVRVGNGWIVFVGGDALATVEAGQTDALLVLREQAKGVLRSGGTAVAYEHSEVEASGESRVYATDDAVCSLTDGASGVFWGKAQVKLGKQSKAVLREHAAAESDAYCLVDAHDFSRLSASGGAVIGAYDHCKVHAGDGCVINYHGGTLEEASDNAVLICENGAFRKKTTRTLLVDTGAMVIDGVELAATPLKVARPASDVRKPLAFKAPGPKEALAFEAPVAEAPAAEAPATPIEAKEPMATWGDDGQREPAPARARITIRPSDAASG